MSHVVIIIQQQVLPAPDAQATLHSPGQLHAEITYRPADTLSDAQIGNHVERIVRRLSKLADD